MKLTIIILIILIVFAMAYVYLQKGKVVINNERTGLILLRGGYRAWWIRYSNGLKYPYRTFRDNLWCFPRFEHCDVRLFIKEIEEKPCSHQWKQGTSFDKAKKYISSHPTNYPPHHFLECKQCGVVTTKEELDSTQSF